MIVDIPEKFSSVLIEFQAQAIQNITLLIICDDSKLSRFERRKNLVLHGLKNLCACGLARRGTGDDDVIQHV